MGLAVAAYPGFVLVLARDLAELVAAALLLAGVLALDRQRPVLAAAVLTLAGLTRESTLVLPLALAVLWTIDAIWRSSSGAVLAGRPAWTARAASGWSRVRVVSFAVPLGVALAWQLVLWGAWGVAPLPRDRRGWACPLPTSGTSPKTPFNSAPSRWWCGSPRSSWWWPRPWPPRGRCPGSRALTHEKLAWALGMGVAVLLSRSVWVEDWAFLRALVEPYLLGILVLLGRPDRRGCQIVVAGALLCLSVAAPHVRSL